MPFQILPFELLFLVSLAAAQGYIPGGLCGSQHNNTLCGETQGCCSAEGYCGTTSNHCLKSNGCQSGCQDGGFTTSVLPTTTTTASPAATTTAAAAGPVLSQGAIGGITGAACVVVLVIAFFVYRAIKSRRDVVVAENAREREHQTNLQREGQDHEVTMAREDQRTQMLQIAQQPHGMQALRAIAPAFLGRGQRSVSDSGVMTPRGAIGPPPSIMGTAGPSGGGRVSSPPPGAPSPGPGNGGLYDDGYRDSLPSLPPGSRR